MILYFEVILSVELNGKNLAVNIKFHSIKVFSFNLSLTYIKYINIGRGHTGMPLDLSIY
jgi:hypothetical protein